MKNQGGVTSTKQSLAALLTGALAVTGIVIMALVAFTLNSYRRDLVMQRHDLRIAELRGIIIHLDEVLTMSARLAATTGDASWEQRYRQFEPQLGAAIAEAVQSGSAEAAAQTDAANLALVEMENRSFLLVREGQREAAQQLLFSDSYAAQKTIYAAGMKAFIHGLNEHLEANHRKKQREGLLAVIALIICLSLLILAWLSILAKLKRTHQQLLETSRLAGMSEVATGVLHNVGNVLNSVNVSVALLREQGNKSQIQNLVKATALLRDHASDTAEFLTNDPKGQRLPGYLIKLGEYLDAERRAQQLELTDLGRNVEHIKEIVAMQQSYAQLNGTNENLDAEILVEDALRMNDAALGRHGVRLVRDFQSVPTVVADKHKVLQILINLIRNAKYALEESPLREKTLTVAIFKASRGRVKIQVADNGIGIAAENLTRIFQHGFTTKKEGHGFGLHSSANAAREMGGNLTANSAGPGTGAVFTLELPIAAVPPCETAPTASLVATPYKL